MNSDALFTLFTGCFGLYFALKWAFGEKRQGPVMSGWPTMHHAATALSLGLIASRVYSLRADISPWMLGFGLGSLFLGILANLADLVHERNVAAALRKSK